MLNERADMIEISETDAKALLAGKVEESEDTDVSLASMITLIKDGILELDPISGWTKGGKDNEDSVPNCIVLSEALGFIDGILQIEDYSGNTVRVNIESMVDVLLNEGGNNA